MQRVFHIADDGRLADGPHADSRWTWIDLESSDVREIIALGRAHGLDPLVIEDLVEETELPKAEAFDSQLLVVFHQLIGEDLEADELSTVTWPGHLLTVHRYPAPTIDWLIEQARTSSIFTEGGPDRMISRLLEAATRVYTPIVDELDDHVERLEDAAIAGDPGVIPEIQVLRRQTIELRRSLAAQRDLAVRLATDPLPLIGDRARMRFADTRNTLNRLVESLDGFRMLLATVLDTYRSSVAEQMNAVMKVLTVFSAILLPLSLMAGLYGMNFTNMPELQWRIGYYVLLGIMATTAIALWLYFARRGFIGGPRLDRVPGAVVRGLGRNVRGIADLVTAPVRLIYGVLDGEDDESGPTTGSNRTPSGEQ